MTFILALGSTAQAGVYLWNGSAGDGLWETPLNWTVTDSLWTWPNEENTTDPNYVNTDVLRIDIIDGGAVTRGDTLRIKGADELTTAVLTLDNASSLSVSGRLSIGADPDGAPRMGELNVLGGSILTILDGANGNDLYAADDPDTMGTINIVDSTVTVFDNIIIDEGEGYINIINSTITADGINIGDSETGVGYLDISGTTTVELGSADLETDEGEGHITIGGSTTLNCDDLFIAEKPNAAESTLLITDNATVTTVDDLYAGDEGTGTITIGGSATVNVGDDAGAGNDANSIGTINIGENATVDFPDELYIANDAGSQGEINISGNATVTIGDDLNIGDDGPGTFNIGENATVDIVDDIYVAHNSAEGVFESYMTISGNATVNCQDLIVANNGGLTGYLHILGNPTIHTTANFYMNDDEGDPAYSEVIMDGGTVIVDGYTTFNDDNPGTAEFIMNGGSFYSADYLNLSDNLDGIAHLTMNGGEMITGDRLRLGKDGGEDIGQVRIFMNGGLLQAEELSDIMITDTKIIYNGGEFRIRQPFQPDPVGDPNTWWGLSEADMQNLIDIGTIEASGVYSIVTDGAYTALVTKVASVPNPANGAEDVALDATLSWRPGFGAVSHDGYIGTSSPPPFLGNTTEVSFDPGGLRPGTTYYWQLNAVEADGTTHAGDIWSFTTMMDTSLVAYYPLDEGGGNIAADASGNGHDGAILGTPTWIDSMSGYGTALYFAGPNPADGYVDCGTWNPSEGTGQLTVALWARYDGPVEGVWQRVIGKRDGWAVDNMMWQIEINRDNQQISFERIELYPVGGGIVLPEGQWAHVAVTFDGTTAVFYVNGEETDRGDFSFGTKTDSALIIGADNPEGWNSFHGALDEVMLYNRALSDLEVLNLVSNE